MTKGCTYKKRYRVGEGINTILLLYTTIRLYHGMVVYSRVQSYSYLDGGVRVNTDNKVHVLRHFTALPQVVDVAGVEKIGAHVFIK